LSSTTFADSLSILPNSLFNAANDSSPDTNFQSSDPRSANTFSFYTSTNLLYIYVKIQFTCSFTIFSLILILIYSLYCYETLWTLTFFFSFYLFFLILYFFSFEFLFPFYWQWRGTWHCSHMTGHMMWCNRPRTW